MRIQFKQFNGVRLFKNPLLERLTHVHPIVPLLMWTPVILFLLARSYYVHHLSVFAISGIAATSLFAWTLTEYVLHRFVFHFPASHPWSKRIVYTFHGLHHDEPNDPTRLVMPPIGGVVIAAVLYPVFRWIVGDLWIEPFFAFFLVGYLCYDYTHYAVHHFRPRTRLGKFLKQHHMLHHFVTPDARFGVSSPVWDYIFGSLHPETKEKEQAV